MNPFSGYRILPAEDIVRNNVHPNKINEDIPSLIATLSPVVFISHTDSENKSSLHSNLIKKLEAKPGVLDLLKHFGFTPNNRNEYLFTEESGDQEIQNRQTAARELKQLFADLKQARDGNLQGFQQFIQRSIRHESASISSDDDDNYHTNRRSFRSPIINRSPSCPSLPNAVKVREGNENTANRVRLFKESLVTRHDFAPAHSFIRRRLTRFLFQQLYPESIDFGEDEIERGIDRKITELKHEDNARNVPREDEIYMECLIRSNFNADQTRQMLITKRPNLKRPLERDTPQGRTTTLALSVHSSREQWATLCTYPEYDGTVQMLLHEGDEWKNAMHVIPAIVRLRHQYPNTRDNDIVASKVYRLLFSELSHIIRPQSSTKIELLAFALCQIQLDTLEHVDMADIKDILRSCDDFAVDERFIMNVNNSLSQECAICTGCFPRSRMESMFLCDHTCCTDCIKRYYRSAIKEMRDPQALNALTCFNAHPLPTDNQEKMNLFQYLGSKFNQWFSDERLLLDTYHENLFHTTRDAQIKKCGNPRCMGFFDPNNNNRVGRVLCPHCQFAQCRNCSRKWLNDHGTMGCEAYSEWLRENDPDDPEVQLLNYLRTAGMMCPNEACKAIYEYQAGGCEHFRCVGCSTEFCRICSALFYNPAKGTVCPRVNCLLKTTLHAHCYLNCYREIRDAECDQILELLNNNGIDVSEEFRNKPIATNVGCPVDGCKNAASVARENRFCESCYKQFLCLFVWRHEIAPWELYADHQLRAKLENAAVPVPNGATRQVLLELAQQHLHGFLGKPKVMPRTIR